MNGATQTTASLKESINQAADRRDIELDAVELVDDDGTQRTFKVLETDAETEKDQVGFQITFPGGPTGDMMFRKRLNQYMDQLQEHVNGGDVEDNDTSTESTDDQEPEQTESEDVDDRDAPSADNESIPSSVSDDEKFESYTTEKTIEMVVTVDDEIESSLDELVDDIEDIERLAERVEEIDERMDRLEDALGGLAQISQED